MLPPGRHGEFVGPVEELVDFIDLLHRERVEVLYHLLSNHLITLDGDHGLGELYITAFLRRKGEQSLDMTAGGRYLDHYARRYGEWRTRNATSSWTGNDSTR